MRVRGGALSLVLIAAVCATLAACGGESRTESEPNAAPGPAVAFFMGGIAQIDTTVCAAERERKRGTNVVTVRDHSRHYPKSVVRYGGDHIDDALQIADRLSIDAVTPMDAVTPTLFEGADVAVIIGGDFKCGP